MGTFISFFNWEGAKIRPQIGPMKIPGCKQFDPYQDRHNVKLFDTLILKRLILKKVNRQEQKHDMLPSIQRVKRGLILQEFSQPKHNDVGTQIKSVSKHVFWLRDKKKLYWTCIH